MDTLRFLKRFLAGLACILLVGCGKGSKETSKPAAGGDTEFPRALTLYLAGFQWGEPNTFNPLSDWPAFPVGGNFNLMYEPLMAFNTLTGDMEPLLARSFDKTSEYVSVTMDPRATWSDGQKVTASDVRFTYEIGQLFKNAPTAFVWDYISKITVDTITDSTANSLVEKITFLINKDRNNPLVVMDFLQNVRIVPRHYLEPMLEAQGGDLSALQKLKIDQNPVVSGPYNLLRYSGEKIVLKRRDDYWGNAALRGNRLPKPQYIIHPIYKSNDHFSIALQQGNLDVSSTFIPRIWMKAKDGVRTWYSKEPFFVPAAMTMFMINVTHYPLSDKNFRRAMAAAINYTDVRELAFSLYSPGLKPGLILPFGMEERYFSAEDAQKYGVSYDPELAKKILSDAGYTSEWDESGALKGMKNAKGEQVPTVFIKSPAGWTDWEAIVKIAVKSMRAAGIDVREGFVDAGIYWQSMPSGDFDLLLHAPNPSVTPSQPWSRLEAVMSSRNWKPQGEKMNENQGRYNNPKSKEYNPAVDKLLKQIPATADETQKKELYRALNAIFMQDQPTLPLVYRPEQFYEFSVANWKNFPSEENPYAPPQSPCFGAGTKALWEIESTNK